MNKDFENLWSKKLCENIEKQLKVAEMITQNKKVEEEIKRITKRNNKKRFFNKLLFINLKLEEVPELPKTKILDVKRPTIEVYKKQEAVFDEDNK